MAEPEAEAQARVLPQARPGHGAEDHRGVAGRRVALAVVEVVREHAAAGAPATRRDVLDLRLAAQPPAPGAIRFEVLADMNPVGHAARRDGDGDVTRLVLHRDQRFQALQNLFADAADPPQVVHGLEWLLPPLLDDAPRQDRADPR